MSYSLSFSEEFFAEDDVARMVPSARPTSIYQAILSTRENAWREIARDVFGVSADRLAPETVFAKVIETNACSNLDDPIDVWIDPAGTHVLRIHSPTGELPLAVDFSP